MQSTPWGEDALQVSVTSPQQTNTADKNSTGILVTSFGVKQVHVH
jgi:hypothetical protein